MSDVDHSVDAGFNREMVPAVDTTYNGWSNYPTWAVNMWLSNDEGLYNEAMDMVVNAGKNSHSMSEDLKVWVTDVIAPDLGASFAADLLGYALGEVDWNEIATAWLSEVDA